MIKNAVQLALLPDQIAKILNERFTESRFGSKFDFNADQLERIKELVGGVSQEEPKAEWTCCGEPVKTVGLDVYCAVNGKVCGKITR